MPSLDEFLRELEFSIASAEMLATTYTVALTQMVEAGRDTAEAELRLWRHMDALSEMRIRRLELREAMLATRTTEPPTGLD